MFRYYCYSDKEIKELLKSMVLIVDKREQANAHIVEGFKSIKVEVVNKSLNYGDYSFILPRNPELGITKDLYFNSHIVIERKNSLDELSQNLAQKRTQFENEFLRSNDCKTILMIENGSYKDVLEQNYQTKLSPASFFSSLMTFQNRYNVTITFIEKEFAYKYIYSTFYYYLREMLKN